MLRSDESNTLEQALDIPLTKKATHFERVSLGNGKVDPFEGKVKDDVWKVVGNKLLRKKASIQQAFEKSAIPNKKNRDNWVETDKYDAGKEWNEGNELMFVWSQRPDGFILDKHSVAKFFGLKDPDSFSLADVVKNGFPHPDLKMFKKRSFDA